MRYLGIGPCVCKLREDKLWTFQVETGHANLSPGQTPPFHHSNDHRSTGGRCSRGASRSYTIGKVRMRKTDGTTVSVALHRTGFTAAIPVGSVSGVRAKWAPVAPEPGVFLYSAPEPGVFLYSAPEPGVFLYLGVPLKELSVED